MSVKILEGHGFSEATIAKALGLRIHRVRQQLTAPAAKLCPASANEILGNYDELPTAKLASMYHTTTQEILRCRQQRAALTDDLITHLYCVRDYSLEDIAKRYNMNLTRLSNRAVAMGLVDEQEPSTKRGRILRYLANGVPPKHIAKKEGCNISTVYTHAKNFGYATPNARLSEETWAIILANTENTISELSRMYKVSRAAIYRRGKK